MALFNLNAFDLLAVSGADAKKFLQGQITCNVDLLSPTHSLEGAICNLKGRVIGDFRLLEHTGVCYLAMAPGMAARVKPVLDKYIVFSRATCEQVNDGVQRIGLIGDQAVDLAVELGLELPLGDGDVIARDHRLLIRVRGATPRYELWQFPESATGSLIPPTALQSISDPQPWRIENIRAGIAHVTPDRSEEYLPEALNYDLSGVINFKKGCYTGQEVVARMHFRGIAKKRLCYLLADRDCGQPQTISCRSDDTEKAEQGELWQWETDTRGHWHILAILPTVAVEPSSHIYLNDDPDCTVTIQSLPYLIEAVGS
ncbi:MAG: folate-binding protein [Gammaproteobacteria bacterium]|nr:folate-binding protein YgfZ [Pseudomonadales bacterium]